MCNYCNEKKDKEVSFKSDLGIELTLCVSCINWEIDELNQFYCEECEQFHSIEEKNFEEIEGQFLCNSCYWAKTKSSYDHNKEHRTYPV